MPTFTDHAKVVRKDGGLKMRKRIVPAYVPHTKTLLLTDPSKMPSLSWSLPAGKACPWALYGEGTICGDCYAQKGRYVMRNVVNAQECRYRWLLECLRTPEGHDQFVSTMVQAITRASNSYFRVHDSGDFVSPTYVKLWVRICEALPEVRFWFPTRTWRVLTQPKIGEHAKREWSLALSGLASLPNVTMRPSALFFNAPAPRIPGMAAGSTACDEMGAVTCPAYTQGNICGSCRACWNAPDQAISYHRH